MPRWVKVAEVSEISPGEGRAIEVEGESIALFNIDGAFHAIDGTCTHVGGPLGEGDLEGNVVTCPWHGAQFDVTTGEVQRPPAGSDLRRYPVKVEGTEVMVGLD